jgi:hypothetical protein
VAACKTDDFIKLYNKKLLMLMKNWNKRICLQHAHFHWTAKRENEIRSDKLDWVELLFGLYSFKDKTAYYAIAKSYFLIVKEDFMEKNYYDLKEWFDGHFETIIEGELLPAIKNKFLKNQNPITLKKLASFSK